MNKEVKTAVCRKTQSYGGGGNELGKLSPALGELVE